jgi:hypothetical protein
MHDRISLEVGRARRGPTFAWPSAHFWDEPLTFFYFRNPSHDFSFAQNYLSYFSHGIITNGNAITERLIIIRND